jgi:hypothetical protein
MSSQKASKMETPLASWSPICRMTVGVPRLIAARTTSCFKPTPSKPDAEQTETPKL